ncbi:MAG: hypothetical protein KF837_44010 [Labilithrix sp.]|nr:hypothetical protein [Labilithrix sp.]
MLLVVVVACGGSTADVPSPSDRHRLMKNPDAGTIDCMPAVPPDRAALCSGPHHQWIRKNCPDVRFTY